MLSLQGMKHIDRCLTSSCPQRSELEFHQGFQQSPTDICSSFYSTVNDRCWTIKHGLLCREITSQLTSSHLSFTVSSSFLDISSHVILRSHLVKCWHPHFQPWHNRVTKIKNAARWQLHLKLRVAMGWPLPRAAGEHSWGKMPWCPANPHSYAWILSTQYISFITCSTMGSVFTIPSLCSPASASLWLCSVFGQCLPGTSLV